MTKDRRCNWAPCNKPIYYGLFCSNECSDKHYRAWQKRHPIPTTTKKETNT